MCLSQPTTVRKYSNRPDPCRVCGSPAWWNGWRRVAKVIRDATGTIRYVTDVTRYRARCSDRCCRAGSWTVYEPGSYPHRLFQLAVVSCVVSQAAFDTEATMSSIAQTHKCSRRSVSRWIRWIERLFSPKQLAQACARLDPDGLPPPRPVSAPRPKLGWILQLVIRFTDLLAHRGVRLPMEGVGWAPLLLHHFVRFGDITLLSSESPPLPVDLDALLI